MPIAIASNLKDFLDKASENVGNMKTSDSGKLFDELTELILKPSIKSEDIEEVLAFFSASVMEMMQTSRKSLELLFENKERFKKFPKFHVLVNAVISIIVQEKYSTSNPWIESVVDALVCGLTAIESETISLSGSSLIKLLKWDDENGRISAALANHSDFVPILTADMCAMFSRMDESGSMAFLRIVRFCELVIDVSDKKSNLASSIIESVNREFIEKVFRNTLRMTRDFGDTLMWCVELLEGCQRGNELVRPLVGEVFKSFKLSEENQNNSEFLKILSHERSRPIEEVASLLFHYKEGNTTTGIIRSESQNTGFIVDDSGYRSFLKESLESFDQFRAPKTFKFNALTPFAIEIMCLDRKVLFNWLPYVCKVAEIEAANGDGELLMRADISRKLNEFLEL